MKALNEEAFAALKQELAELVPTRLADVLAEALGEFYSRCEECADE